MFTGIILIVIGLAIIVIARAVGLSVAGIKIANLVGGVLAVVGLIFFLFSLFGAGESEVEIDSAPRVSVVG